MQTLLEATAAESHGEMVGWLLAGSIQGLARENEVRNEQAGLTVLDWDEEHEHVPTFQAETVTAAVAAVTVVTSEWRVQRGVICKILITIGCGMHPIERISLIVSESLRLILTDGNILCIREGGGFVRSHHQ